MTSHVLQSVSPVVRMNGRRMGQVLEQNKFFHWDNLQGPTLVYIHVVWTILMTIYKYHRPLMSL